MTLEALLRHLQKPTILDVDGKFVPIDLSVNNLATEQLASASDYESYVRTHLDQNNAKAAFGGYLERRNLYQSELFDNDGDPRNIHIGIDIWAPAATPVHAPLTGTVHSFNYNTGSGNYGPTIILEHKIENLTFYTLYGHLDVDSISELEIGDIFGSGQRLAALGDPTVNGGYAPHLHFQIIKSLEGYEGDYPGVCSEATLEHYLKNCPDPNLLLKLN